MKENIHLKETLSNFQITNLELAKATGIDPSLVSRYLSGNRKLKGSGKHAEKIAEYLLVRADTADRIEWIKSRLATAGLAVRATSVMSIKHNLVRWISSDGETMDDIDSGSEGLDEIPEEGNIKGTNKNLRIGVLPITEGVSELLQGIQKDKVVDIFLTSDRIRILTNEAFSSMLKEFIMSPDSGINVNLVIGISGNTNGINTIIQCYMKELLSGKMRFYSFFGATQNVSEQMYLIFRHKEVVMVSETPIGMSEPIGTFIQNPVYVDELCQSFDATYRYSQPMFNIYEDKYVSTMMDVIFGEYCLPGPLCVVKDSVNPMYMSPDGYYRILKKIYGPDEEEFTKRCHAFDRFHDGFEKMLKMGMQTREIISLARLEAIKKDGKCKMAGLYFMSTGCYDLDLEGCRDILKGYIEHLNKYKCFSLLILDDLPELNRSNCWHVKENRNIAINDWNKDQRNMAINDRNKDHPIMCVSSNTALIQEFQSHFDRIWQRGSGSLSNRALVISNLQEIINEMDELIAANHK